MAGSDLMNLAKYLAIVLIVSVFNLVPVAASVSFQTSCPNTVAIGDSITISGTDAGNGSVAVWVIGRNYFQVTEVVPDSAGSFSLVIPPNKTRNFSSGQYVMLLQDASTDKTLNIVPQTTGRGNITLMSNGEVVADLGSRDDLHAVIRTLEDVIPAVAKKQKSDDIFQSYPFFAEVPFVYFDPETVTRGEPRVSFNPAGNPQVISGITNMGRENTLFARIHLSASSTVVTQDTLPIIEGNVLNHWSYKPDLQTLRPGQYYITVGWMKSNMTGTGSVSFTVG
jgi:hypothetical protein